MDSQEEREVIQVENQHVANIQKFSKMDLERMFGANNKNLSFVEMSGRSDVWKAYKIVQFNEEALPFVKCNNCHSFYGWKKQDGTSTLSTHSKKCGGSTKVSNKSSNSQSHISIMSKFLQKPSQKAIQDLNKEIMIGFAKDIRPLSSIEGAGFKRYAQALINFGAQFGAHGVDDVLQSRVTLKKYMHETALFEKRKITEKLQTEALLTGSYFAVTFDMWSDGYKQRPFLSSTLHYIDDQFVMKRILLGVDQYVVNQSDEPEKSTKNIRTVMVDLLQQYFSADQLQLVLENLTSVTDSGSNVKGVFKKRYSCKCHDLNLALEWTFEKENEKEKAQEKLLKKKSDIDSKVRELEDLPSKAMECSQLIEKRDNLILPPKKAFILSKDCPNVKKTLVALKALVSFFKQTALNKELNQSLKQEVPTRWNSHLTMIESYQKSRVDVKKILCSKNKLVEKLQNIDDSLIDQLVELLKIFRECTESLGADKKPTIHLVAQWKEELKKHLQEKPIDLPEIKKLKKQLDVCLEEYFRLSDLHHAATMLDPRCRSLKFLPADQQDAAKHFLKEMFSSVKYEDLHKTSSIFEELTPTESAQPPKKSRFADLQDEENETDPNSFECELQRYLNIPVTSKEGLDILEFWKAATQCPSLRKTALRILGIPASQTSDERTFSTTGQTLSSRRSALSGSTVSDLTFINKNM